MDIQEARQNLSSQQYYSKFGIPAFTPPGVWEELKRTNPADNKGNRRYRHWRFLTEDIGNPHLEKQLIAVTTLMRSAPDWRTFEKLFARAFPSKEPRQLELSLIPEADQEVNAGTIR